MTPGRLWPKIAIVWAVAAAVLLAVYGRAVIAGTPSDSDDYFRLLEVRDWLGGQSWWDITQYRMNPPAGGAMHWSRLVDVPLAAGLGLFSPLGQHAAEAITTALVPLLLLGALLVAVARATTRLFEGQVAPVTGAALTLASGYVLVQMFPGRIDHHGWQILMAAAALAALLDPRQARSGALAGIALAFWLDVSIEGLPFTVAAAGALALRWVVVPEERGRLTAFMLALAGATVLFFVATRPISAWHQQWCDAVSPAHVIALAATAAAVSLAAGCGNRWRPAARVAALAAGAALGGAIFALMAPNCLGGPFGRLDPLVQSIWYGHVMEGLPIWRQSRMDALEMLFFPAVGIVGTLSALRRAHAGEPLRRWLLVLILALASIAVAMLIRRATGVAHVLAVPGALALIEPLRRRAQRLQRPIARILAAVAAFVLPSPLPPIYAQALLARPTAQPPLPPGPACDLRCSLAPIAALPPADIFAPIDSGAALLAFSHHRIVAGPYHRNDTALADIIRAYTGMPDAAHAIVLRRRSAYVLIDPRSAEADVYRVLAPDGLMARLLRGDAPPWLRPVPLGNSRLKLWRVTG